MTTPLNVEEIIRPALDAYGEALGAHGHGGGDYVIRPGGQYVARCVCGWESAPKTRAIARRSVGLHVSAARKRASKECDVESARLLDEARKVS